MGQSLLVIKLKSPSKSVPFHSYLGPRAFGQGLRVWPSVNRTVMSSPNREEGSSSTGMSNDDVGQNCGKKGRFSERSWEELDWDCLTNVLSKVGMESLLLAVPFVCKSWYKTSLNPLCWQNLSFPDFLPYPLFIDIAEEDDGPLSFGPFYDKFVNEYGIDRSRFSITAFVKSVVDRSNGKAIYLTLPEFCTEEALRYVSDECPLLKFLWLTDDLVVFKHSQIMPEVIGKWKLLECLILGSGLVNIVEQIGGTNNARGLSKHFEVLLTSQTPLCYNVLDRILEQTGTHCKYLSYLMIYDDSLGEVEASTIVNLLPNLKKLLVRNCRIERDSVVTLLRGCKELVLFDAKNCEGFEESDEEISKLAFRIHTYSCNSCVSRELGVLRLFSKVRKVIFMMLDL